MSSSVAARLALATLAAWTALSLAASNALAHSAWETAELHVGDGRVLYDAVVLVDDAGVVERVGRIGEPGSVPAHADLHRVPVLMPGLVAAAVRPAGGFDPASVDPDRLAVEQVELAAPREDWLSHGVTSIVLTPGDARLVGGRAGVLRLTRDVTDRAHVRLGPVVASLTEAALSPPPIFEPDAPVNVDNPLEPARPQRPGSATGAVAELRRLVAAARAGGGHEAFRRLARRETSLRVRASSEEEVRRAVALARELDIELVIEGGEEAWKLANEVGDVGAAVVLAVSGLRRADRSLDTRLDAAALLSGAGVSVSLVPAPWLRAGALDDGPLASPLLLAGMAVRHGVAPADAIPMITANAARAAGAGELGLIRPGAPADLLALDASPLSLRARPLAVVVGGIERWRGEPAVEEAESVLVIGAGAIETGERRVADARIVVRDGRVAGVGAGSAVPAGADERDYGHRAVIVPGFVDSFSHLGLEPGGTTAGGSRFSALEAVEADLDSWDAARSAGITAALVVPDTAGIVPGAPALLATAAPAPDAREDPPVEPLSPGAGLDVLEADAGLVFLLDMGPGDTGARGQRTDMLSKILKKAKQYHDRKKAATQKPPSKPDAKPTNADHPPHPDRFRPGGPKAKTKKVEKPEAPDDDPDLEPYGAIFAGKATAWLRAGRRDSIVAGLDAFRAVGVTPVLVGGEEADVVADDLAKRKVAVILGPDVLRSEPGRLINVAAELREAGVTVALGSFSHSGSELLPLAAARAVRHGLAPEDALAALTRAAVEATGGPDDLGRIEPGDRADLVVFSGDPLEPTSRVLAVVVGGRLVETWAGAGVGQ